MGPSLLEIGALSITILENVSSLQNKDIFSSEENDLIKTESQDTSTL